MIDLCSDELPRTIETSAGVVLVDTSFRSWLLWGRLLLEEKVISKHVLLEEPEGEWYQGALEFWRNPIPTPRGQNSKERTFDYLLDGDYIVGAFQQAYGIDLTSAKMHWHRFLALMRSLPSDTKFSKITGYRSYDPSSAKRKQETVLKQAKEDWTLPKSNEAELIAWQKEIFGGIVPEGVEEDA